jgi:ribonuclease P protein component
MGTLDAIALTRRKSGKSAQAERARKRRSRDFCLHVWRPFAWLGPASMQKPCAPRSAEAPRPSLSGLPAKALAHYQGSALAALERLRRRADFLRAAKGKRVTACGFTLQVARHQTVPPLAAQGPAPEQSPAAAAAARPSLTGSAQELLSGAEIAPRIGFTVTRQSGGAVQRNRIRRRLKEALRLLHPLPARPGHDYVIFARPEALCMRFQALQAELVRAFKKAHPLDSSPPIRHDRQGPAAGGLGKEQRRSLNGRTPKG